MIQAASEVFGQRGYYATAFSDVIQESGAPRGSIYFHFPGGKEELAREAIALAGDEIEETVAQAASQADAPGSLIRALAEIMVQRLEGSDYKHGCSIATMVLELAPHDEELSVEFDKVFARWRAALVARFEPWGIAPDGGVVLADLVMSAFEGALILSRAARSSEPFWNTVEALVKLIDHDTAFRPVASRAQRRAPRAAPVRAKAAAARSALGGQGDGQRDELQGGPARR
jgi:TetR/AcrR family transcriptional repressor of lmrAB and yxaGH operons